MGRAIDMENDISNLKIRTTKLEAALEEMIRIVENIRRNLDKIQNQRGKSNVKKKAND